MSGLLELKLEVRCREAGGAWREILRGVELELRAGEVLGLAGQSGSGKSTLALAVLGLLRRERFEVAGTVQFQGRELLGLSEGEWRRVRGRHVALVPQSPLAALNGWMRIGEHFREAWAAHGGGKEWVEEARAALRAVELPDGEEFLRRYPGELSVGMAQRVLVALAVLHRPEVVIADEATSALDVITQAEVLGLFRRVAQEFGTALLFITHDLMAAAEVCGRIAILHEGRIVECAGAREVFEAPRHEYTRRLVGAVPGRVFKY